MIRIKQSPPIAMPAIAPLLSGPLWASETKVAVAAGPVTLTSSAEKMLPSMERVSPGSGCSVHAPSRTSMTIPLLVSYRIKAMGSLAYN